MTPEKQRIAIAEACGWMAINNPTVYKYKRTNPKWQGGVEYAKDAPDYTNDLNAMREAEETITEDQERAYCLAIYQTVRPGEFRPILRREFDVCHATASQRAEAFLRTIGKWIE